MSTEKQWKLDMTIPITAGSARHVVFFPEGKLKNYFGQGLDVYILLFGKGDGFTIVEPYEPYFENTPTMNFPTTSLSEAVCLYVQASFDKHGIEMTTEDREAIKGLLH